MRSPRVWRQRKKGRFGRRSGFAVRFPCVALRWRLMVLVMAAIVPVLYLILQHAKRDRVELMAEAEQGAARLARFWAGNHDALLREAHILAEAVAASSASTHPAVDAAR